MTEPIFRSPQAASFGEAAAAYERGRPPYPPEAVDWLLPPGPPRVVDLGAGTGKLTRQLVDRGADVVAVEPSDGMRRQLRQGLPGVRALAGSAEQIPVGDGSADVVLVAQAWHWVDVERAVPEVARVLAPGGRLGLLWNIRDEREDWAARLGRIMHPAAEQDMMSASPPIGPPFGPAERRDIAWTHRLTPDQLVDLVASRSYFITRPEPERADALAWVRELLATHPQLAGRAQIEFPYVTRCHRAHLS